MTDLDMTDGVATGFVTRGWRSEADWAQVADVQNACRAADGYDWTRSPDQLRAGLATFAGFEPADDLRIAEADGRVVGFAYGALDGDNPELGRILFHTGGVLPGWRGRGIGRRLLAEAQDAARRQGARSPQPAPSGAVLRAYLAESDVDARRLLEHDGYRVVRYGYSMVRPTLDDPPPPDLPPGIEARPTTTERALQVLQAMNEAMADHWGASSWPDEQLEAAIAHPLLGQLDVWQVAWDGDEVAGGVLGFINEEENIRLGRRRGYTENIFTRRGWRGRGIATALIGRNLRLLAERGMAEAALMVDAENPTGALALYERVGFVRDRTDLVYQRPA